MILNSPAIEKLQNESRRCARPVTKKARELAAEHLRRDNDRYGREIWSHEEIGEVVCGKRDHAPVVQAIADALDILQEKDL
jgi:hypothetical protein